MTFISTLARYAGLHAKAKRSLGDYISLARQRRQLGKLSPDQLKDIGISRDAAQREANRLLWDAPSTWRK